MPCERKSQCRGQPFLMPLPPSFRKACSVLDGRCSPSIFKYASASTAPPLLRQVRGVHMRGVIHESTRPVRARGCMCGTLVPLAGALARCPCLSPSHTRARNATHPHAHHTLPIHHPALPPCWLHRRLRETAAPSTSLHSTSNTPTPFSSVRLSHLHMHAYTRADSSACLLYEEEHARLARVVVARSFYLSLFFSPSPDLAVRSPAARSIADRRGPLPCCSPHPILPPGVHR